jgi:predicted nucleic-acid-binding Zn-ribbon protein
MPLNHEQAHRLERWLNSRGISFNCPMCGSTQWETGEIVSGVNVSGHGDVVVPMVQVICSNCGYVMLFAATPIGLV